MNDIDKSKKNKQGIANILVVIGTAMVILSIITFFGEVEKFGDPISGTTFLTSLIGTILIFGGGYIRNGHITFFN